MGRLDALKGEKQLHAADDCGQAGSAWQKEIVKGNKLFPLTKYAIRENCDLRENRCPLFEKTKQRGQQKFKTIRLQI